MTYVSIRWKLFALIAGAVALPIGFVMVLLPMSRTAALETQLRTKASSFSRMLVEQTRSAIAFDDTATAREVFAAVASDSDVAAVALYRANGSVLAASGTVETQAPPWTAVPVLSRHGNRVRIVAPVVAEEGPRGVLLLELSTAEARAEGAKARQEALLIGLVGLILGCAAAWLVGTSFGRRLLRIRQHAARVAGGDFSDVPRTDKAGDEIGALTSEFQAMVVRLRGAYADIERQVAERTEALRASQAELQQAQKLESVGRLASGVAHEINTPIQFVSDSVHFVRDALADVLPLLARYHQIGRDGNAVTATDALEEIHQEAETADIDYITENAPPALERALEGLDRVATIVRSMKQFAHPDQRGKALANLNQALASTLIIARSEYKEVADVETSYGSLPDVSCHVGELNQAFLNILVNASHAIGDVVKKTGQRGLIKVVTRYEGNAAVIEISDSGGGIPEEIRARIFDPFFTTKEVGRGTGQGLAIAHRSVIEKHGGALTFHSEMGRGTTFVIRIPNEQTDDTQSLVA